MAVSFPNTCLLLSHNLIHGIQLIWPLQWHCGETFVLAQYFSGVVTAFDVIGMFLGRWQQRMELLITVHWMQQ
jgi:hypothetical protein